MRNTIVGLVGLMSMAALAAPQQFDRASRLALARRNAADGIVLLRNEDNVLPLKPGQEIALLGFSSYACFRMGCGSGDMLAIDPVEYDEGLKRAGVKLMPSFDEYYRKLREERRPSLARLNRDWVGEGFWTYFHYEPRLSWGNFDEVAGNGKNRDKVAVVTVGRTAGENVDRRDRIGEFRLDREHLLLQDASRNFDRIVLLLNVPGQIDLGFLEEFPKIKAIVYTSMLGETSGDAVADVLTGKVNPSGRLTDSWARHYRDYPTTDCFDTDDVIYHEGLYMGYRYFDKHAENLVFPFGFGLSYTTYAIEPGKLVRDGLVLTLPVTVRNTGDRAGREVVQVYLAAPSVKLDQPVKKLCAFAKTPTIPAGGEVTVTIKFDLREQASFCEKTASWVLEPGNYGVLVGDSSVNVQLAGVAKLNKLEIVQQVTNRFNGRPTIVERKPLVKKAKGFVKMQDVLAGKATLEDLVAQMTDDELTSMCNGRITGSEQTGNTGVGGVTAVRAKTADEAGEFWSSRKYGIPANNCVDGPSGLRLSSFDRPVSNYNPIATTVVAWPCCTALSQSWDLEAAERFGRAIANECELADIDGWLAPGINLHRNPLCGRNFEYCSEDPYLSGKVGAAIVRGVQVREDGKPSGRYATVKHFAVNNQEFERWCQNNILDERTLRELYLKPFEIAVREGHPLAVMSSYNKINGVYCGEDPDLLRGVLRDEWGFDGAVMTDWNSAGDKDLHPRAGNDAVMPGYANDKMWMMKALKNGKMKRADAQAAAVNVLKLVLNSMRWEGETTSPAWNGSEWIVAPQARAAVKAAMAKPENGRTVLTPAATCWFRRDVVNRGEVVRATWLTTALGTYELYVNGERVGDDFLKPGFTHGEKTRRSFEYDVTGLMHSEAQAKNVFAAEVSTGWWSDAIIMKPGRIPAFRGVLVLKYADGSEETVSTKRGAWLAAVGGPITRAGIFEGEDCDARMPLLAIGGAGYVPAVSDDQFNGDILPSAGAEITVRRELAHDWRTAYVYDSDERKLKGRNTDVKTDNECVWGSVVRTREYEPGDTLELKPGETMVLDFGQNCAAIPSFEFKSVPGAKLSFYPAEMLNDGNGERSRGNDGPAGSVYRDNLRSAWEGNMEANYTFATDEYETYEPRFTFFGYRYAAIRVTKPVEIKSIRQMPVTSIRPEMETGKLVTGNADVNKLISNVYWGQLSNYLSIPTDCPQRNERQGWTADTQVFAEAGSFNAYTDPFFHKWTRDLRDTQTDTGAYTGVAPKGEYGNAGAMRFGWADAGVIVPWTIWKQFGDVMILRENWDSMEKYMKHVAATKYDMSVIRNECEDYQWGDWLSYEPLESCGGGAFTKVNGKDVPTPAAANYWNYLGGCYWAYDAGLMSEMAKALGSAADSLRYAKMAAQAKEYLKIKFFDQDGDFIDDTLNGMQTPALFALKLGLVEGEAKTRMIAALRKNFADHGGCLQTGFLGTSILMDTLTANGMSDIAYGLLLQHKNPSWLYSVDQGATTVWERWNSYVKDTGFGPVSMNSFNHYAYGAVLAWLYKTAAGIASTTADPGFKTIVMAPVPDRRLGSVDATYRSVAGTIHSDWHYEGPKWIWHFSVPDGAKALVTPPGAASATEYGPGEHTLELELK